VRHPRILALQLKRIGDLILTAPALGALHAAFPDSTITLLCGRSAADLLPAMPCTRGFALGRPGFWSAVLGHRFDLCLDFTGSDRSALLGLLSRAATRATFLRHGKNFPRRLAWNAFVDSRVRERHTVDHHGDLLGAVGVAFADPGPSLRWPEETALSARGLLDAAGVRGPCAVLHPGTARPEKAWPPENWARVAVALMGRGLAVVVTGAGDDTEHGQAAAVCALAPGACNLSGRTSLLELAALIRGADIFCGVDSAAMHLAGAADTPSVCLFGPTNPFHWAPRNSKARVIRAGTRPPFTPDQRGGPMDAISAGEVIEALEATP
jgi:heptosyltransferase III